MQILLTECDEGNKAQPVGSSWKSGIYSTPKNLSHTAETSITFGEILSPDKEFHTEPFLLGLRCSPAHQLMIIG